MKVRTRYVLESADFSAQEPRILAMMCQDEGMLNAYKEGKDLYAEIASIALGFPYEDCLEFYPVGTPLRKEEDKYIIDKEEYTLISDGSITNKEGKERRSQAKKILLGIMYGRGHESIAEQLNCSPDEALEIKESVYKSFPKLQEFEESSKQMALKLGYVTDLWGRKRRLVNLKLPEYSAYDNKGRPLHEVEYSHHIAKLKRIRNFEARGEYIRTVQERYGISIRSNFFKIKEAERQIINARIQGSASSMTKKACAVIDEDEELKSYGARLIVPIHDEIILKTPLRYGQETRERFVYLMENCAKDKMTIDIKCDVTCSFSWYGEEVDFGKELDCVGG